MNNDQYPLVSLCILTYKQEKFVEDTIKGALSQTYENLEIIISDDCSPDGTYEIIKKITTGYKGPHRLIINRNEKNMGIVPHVNKLIFELSHGRYVMLSGGDDVCMPHLITNAMAQLLCSGCSSMAFNAYIIDGDSNQTGMLSDDVNHPNEIYTLEDFIAGRHKTNGACRIIKRDVFETFGPLDENCQTEDTPDLFRTFLYGKVGYCYTPNLKYRIHGNNISEFHSLMTKFNPLKIARQYKKDIELALAKGLINQKQYKQLIGKVAKYKRKNVWLRIRYRIVLCIKRIIHLS